jgi:5'-nucleotidase
MKCLRCERAVWCALVVAWFGVLVGAHELRAQAAGGPGLDILLTNDDGYEAPGLASLRAALMSAGHSVTVVAPLDNRSGSGVSATSSGLIDYYQQADGVWAVDGTPTDAVSLALVHLLRATPPDLVVSGSNFGQNVGANVIESGTVGAAITASRMGLPAIAVSVAVELDERGAAPPYPSTTEAFAPAADFVVGLVRQLHETDAEGLLPPRTVLNVNYPAVGAGEVTGVRFAPLASVRAFRRVYTVAGETGPARVEIAEANIDRAEDGSDVDLVANGYVTISVLDGDWDGGRQSWEPLLERLAIER